MFPACNFLSSIALRSSGLISMAALAAISAALPSDVPIHVSLVDNHSSTATACSHSSCQPVSINGASLTLPLGSKSCPKSGIAATCSDDGSASAVPGTASTPDGESPCPPGEITSAASCGVQSSAVAHDLELTTDSPSPGPGDRIVLKATSRSSVSGTGRDIEIFDISTGTLIAACAQGNQCVVAYSATSSVHTFEAFITAPTRRLPSTDASVVGSSQLSASWLAVKLQASTTATGPGKPITIAASSSVSYKDSGYELEIFDLDHNRLLTYCSEGNTCSVTLSQSEAGINNVIADLAKPSDTFPPPDAKAQSQLLGLTWLSVRIEGRTSGRVGSPVYLTAVANADLTSTRWGIGILDEQEHLIAPMCKNGSVCTAQVALPSGPTPSWHAVIGAAAPNSEGNLLSALIHRFAPAGLPVVDVQANSNPVQPVTVLWGVDSCKAFTQDPNGVTGLYPQVASTLGRPDFWGRYLTDTVCPGISWAEISAALHNHMAILPIYNDYNCSNVSGYATGVSYAAAAVAAAKFLHIPQGVGIAVDIEPPGEACPGAANVDPGFLQGWFDGVRSAHYVPVYYGNGTSGSEFASAWCVAATQKPEMLGESYQWSFEPSLIDDFSKAAAPSFAPNQTGCGGWIGAWQYRLSAGSSPDVDQDEAVTTLPLWYPTPW